MARAQAPTAWGVNIFYIFPDRKSNFVNIQPEGTAATDISCPSSMSLIHHAVLKLFKAFRKAARTCKDNMTFVPGTCLGTGKRRMQSYEAQLIWQSSPCIKMFSHQCLFAHKRPVKPICSLMPQEALMKIWWKLLKILLHVHFELNWLLIISDEPRLAKLQTWTIQRWSSCLWRHLWLLWAFRPEIWEWNQRCKSQMQSQSVHMQCRAMVFSPRLTNHLHCNMMQHVTLLPTCRCKQGTGASISGSASKGNAASSVFQTFSEDQSHATYFAYLLGKHPNISTSSYSSPTFHRRGFPPFPPPSQSRESSIHWVSSKLWRLSKKNRCGPIGPKGPACAGSKSAKQHRTSQDISSIMVQQQKMSKNQDSLKKWSNRIVCIKQS